MAKPIATWKGLPLPAVPDHYEWVVLTNQEYFALFYDELIVGQFKEANDQLIEGLYYYSTSGISKEEGSTEWTAFEAKELPNVTMRIITLHRVGAIHGF